MLFKIKFKSINPSFYRMNIDHNLLRENKNIGRYSINQYLKSAGFITRKNSYVLRSKYSTCVFEARLEFIHSSIYNMIK